MDLVEISINIAGNDYSINVDMDTAQTLLNDQNLAEAYIKQAFPNDFPEYLPNFSQNSENTLNLVEVYDPPHSPDRNVDTEMDNDEDETQVQLKKVWFSKGKPTKADEEATIYFLKLREKYSNRFDDKKSVKNKLWAAIANDMKAARYDISCSKEDGSTKCKQKFANLESKYIKHVEHMKTTGSQFKDPPPYFDQMHSILSHKHKVNPETLQDTETTRHLENSSLFVEVGANFASPTGSARNRYSSSHPENVSPPSQSLLQPPVQPSCSRTSDEPLKPSNIEHLTNSPLSIRGEKTNESQNQIKNRFKNTDRLKPKVNKSDKVIEEMKRQFELEQLDRKEFLKEIKKQNQQRKQLIDILGELAAKRRRLHDIDEGSDDN